MNASRASTIDGRQSARNAASAAPSSERVPALYAALALDLLATDNAIVEGNTDEKSRRLEAATADVFELIASVDFERGGELAPRLAALYSYFSSELLHIARTEDRSQIRLLLDMIGVLTDSWHDGSVTVTG